MMYAPRTNHDCHCGRNSTYKNRFGCFKSTTSSTPVTTRKNIATNPSTSCRLVELSAPNVYLAVAAAKNPPAAIDFVQMYATTGQPQICFRGRTSYTRRGDSKRVARDWGVGVRD